MLDQGQLPGVMRILLIEDDEVVAEMLTTALTRQHYVVDVAVDGQAGWELVDGFSYDLILLDVMLPKLDGISLCRRLRSQGDQTPVLLLTAQDTGANKVIGLDAGADDYVTKPFDMQELLARLRALLRREGSTLLPILEWENLQLDPGPCEVTCDGQPIYLRPKEYDLLELFLRNPHRVFSRGAILDHLWSFEEAPGEETITAHIKGLRRHLKAAGVSHDPIETVYGMGYRLREQGKLESRGAGEAEGAGEAGGENTLSAETKSKIQNPKSKIQVSPEVEQRAVAVAAGIWGQTKEKFSQRVAVVEQATQALLADTLGNELRQEAERAAHKLAGSLGMFNFDQGSKLAREIEQLFHAEGSLNPDQRQRLSDLTAALSQDIQRAVRGEIPNLLQTQTTNRALRTAPLLLIVTPDQSLADALLAESKDWKLETQLAPDPAAARLQVSSDRPDVVLLDLLGGQETGGRRQETGDRRQKTEGRRQKVEVKNQKSEVRSPKSGAVKQFPTANASALIQNPKSIDEQSEASRRVSQNPSPPPPPESLSLPPASLSFLAELSAYSPPIPVLVMTDQDSLADRIKVARLGGARFFAAVFAETSSVRNGDSGVTEIAANGDSGDGGG